MPISLFRSLDESETATAPPADLAPDARPATEPRLSDIAIALLNLAADSRATMTPAPAAPPQGPATSPPTSPPLPAATSFTTPLTPARDGSASSLAPMPQATSALAPGLSGGAGASLGAGREQNLPKSLFGPELGGDSTAGLLQRPAAPRAVPSASPLVPEFGATATARLVPVARAHSAWPTAAAPGAAAPAPTTPAAKFDPDAAAPTGREAGLGLFFLKVANALNGLTSDFSASPTLARDAVPGFFAELGRAIRPHLPHWAHEAVDAQCRDCAAKVDKALARRDKAAFDRYARETATLAIDQFAADRAAAVRAGDEIGVDRADWYLGILRRFQAAYGPEPAPAAPAAVSAEPVPTAEPAPAPTPQPVSSPPADTEHGDGDGGEPGSERDPAGVVLVQDSRNPNAPPSSTDDKADRAERERLVVETFQRKRNESSLSHLERLELMRKTALEAGVIPKAFADHLTVMAVGVSDFQRSIAAFVTIADLAQAMPEEAKRAFPEKLIRLATRVRQAYLASDVELADEIQEREAWDKNQPAARELLLTVLRGGSDWGIGLDERFVLGMAAAIGAGRRRFSRPAAGTGATHWRGNAPDVVASLRARSEVLTGTTTPRPTTSLVGKAHEGDKLPGVSTIDPKHALTVERFRKEFGNTGLADPNTIQTTQIGVSSYLRKETRSGSSHTESSPEKQDLADLVAKLKNGTIKPTDLPPILLYGHNGIVTTADHRRLVAARLAGVPVHYRVATEAEMLRSLESKFDLGVDSLKIIIRSKKGVPQK